MPQSPIPCSFPDFLAFTESGYDSAVQTYLGLLDSSCIYVELQKTTNIMTLLRSKGVKAFMPQNVEGVHVKPLHNMDFVEGMSSFMKPRAQCEHAHKEFLRLSTYMYVRCDCPVACPLWLLHQLQHHHSFVSVATIHRSTSLLRNSIP